MSNIVNQFAADPIIYTLTTTVEFAQPGKSYGNLEE